jgi:hypothetical protein
VRCLPRIRGLVLALAVAATNIWHDGRGLEDCSIADGNTWCKFTCNQSIKQAIKQSSNQLKEERKLENWKIGKLENSNPRGMHLIENSDEMQGSLDPLLHGRCFPPFRATTAQHASVVSAAALAKELPYPTLP